MSKKGATRLSFASAHNLSRSFAYAHRRTRVRLSLVVKHALSGQRDWLDFLLKNLRRCVGFIWRYTRLAKPPCRTRSLACLQLIACNLQTKKATFSGDFFCLWSCILLLNQKRDTIFND